MKMNSKGRLLLTLTGVIAFGCSAPADDPDPPTTAPPYFGQPQTPMQMQQPLNPMNPVGASGGAGGAGGATNTPVGGAGATNMPPGGAAGSVNMPPAGGGGPIPVGAPGTGFALVPVNGWVAGGTNEAGIQGAFYPLTDADGTPPGNTTLTPEDFSMASGPLCVSGSASQVLNGADGNPAYGQYWGGGVGFNLSDPGAMAPLVPWARGSVVGFSFNVTGPTIPPAGQLRFGVDFYEGAAINETACAVISGGANTVMFSQVVSECWEGGVMAPPLPATAMLRSIKWQVATVTASPTPFDFCIENLTAIVQ